MELKQQPKTPKEVFIIRHGQGEHNVLFETGFLKEAREVLDPGLTDKGKEQAAAVQSNALLPATTELIVCSPLRRTIETCCQALGKMMKDNTIPVVLNPDLQEVGPANCNTGSSKEVVEGELLGIFPEGTAVDTSLLTPTSNIKTGRYSDDDGEKILQRIEDFMKWLEKRPEKNIGIVAHHHTILFMSGISFMNAELRQFYLYPRAKKLTARAPLLSMCDTELSAEELAHCKTYGELIREKEKLWNVTFPGRLR